MKDAGYYVAISIIAMLMGCQTVDYPEEKKLEDESILTDEKYSAIGENVHNCLDLRQGHVSQKADTFRVIRNNKAIAAIVLSAPVIVAQADKDEEWGYFQFPIIFRDNDKNLVVKWQMRSDSQSDYGLDLYGRKISSDEGKTWNTLTNISAFDKERYYVELSNGDVLQVKDPVPRPIGDYSSFPTAVNSSPIANTFFFLEKDVPNELRGVYLQKWHRFGGKVEDIHASIKDDKLLRCAADGVMPIVWWGDINEQSDGNLIAGMYGGYYQNSSGEILRSSVSFYQSKDGGYQWNLVGKIPYLPIDGLDYEDYVFDGEDGFTEPSFAILKEKEFVCVMRTSSRTPMYRSFSKDGGINWSRPEPFTPNGVLPSLLRLDNNVLVLTSGRPGIQLRLCIDGDGVTWTDPVEFIRYLNEDGTYDIWKDTCGYANLLVKDSNSFYVVYSDFTMINECGEKRKTILLREVKVVI